MGFREPGIGKGCSTDDGMGFREPGIGKWYSTDEDAVQMRVWVLGNLI